MIAKIQGALADHCDPPSHADPVPVEIEITNGQIWLILGGGADNPCVLVEHYDGKLSVGLYNSENDEPFYRHALTNTTG